MIDLDEHVDHIDNRLDYYYSQRIVKCKLFMLSIKGADMKWLNALSYMSVNS